jgi:uncharacterized membrane protein
MESAEKKKRSGVPIGMPIAAVVLLVLGLVARPLILNNVSEQQLARNVLLSAIPFILIFAAIVVAFMSVVWFAASRLNENVSQKLYRPIELALMGGILLGIFFMFQPWIFELFRVGFFLLLGSTLGFILWSHVRPKGTHQEELRSVSVGEYEKGSGD